jgi:hypothetical protein
VTLSSTLLLFAESAAHGLGPFVASKATNGVDMHKHPATSRSSNKDGANGQNSGISNRESAAEESLERATHPPVDRSSLPPEDAGGDVGEQPTDDYTDRQTSHKAGGRSIAQKKPSRGIQTDRCRRRRMLQEHVARSPTSRHGRRKPTSSETR